MRFATLQVSPAATESAVLHHDRYVPLRELGLPSSMGDLLALGEAGLEQLRTKRTSLSSTAGIAAAEAKLAAPVSPRQIICVGKNYKLHVHGGGESQMPPEPIIFPKSPGCLTGPGAAIEIPAFVKYPDYEAELAVVIGKQGKNIPEAQAMDYVFGFTCGHDVSARDHQLSLDLSKIPPGKQWMRGKTFDTFAPLGPVIVTPDEIPDPHALRIQCLRDGKPVQDTHRPASGGGAEQVERMHFTIPFLLHWISQGHTLFPGDVILTGTPSGTAMELDEKPWMRAGETYTVRIEGIGELTNEVSFLTAE